MEYNLDSGTTIIDASLSLDAEKNSVRIIDAGSISSAKTINFAVGGCYKCTATGVIALTVTSLGVGQHAIVDILSGTPAPTLTFVGVDAWVNDIQPGFVATKNTVVSLFNDGTKIIGQVVPSTVELEAWKAAVTSGSVTRFVPTSGEPTSGAINELGGFVNELLTRLGVPDDTL